MANPNSKTDKAPEKTAEQPVDSFSKIDALFANSPGKVRVKHTSGKVYNGIVSPTLVAQFLTAGQEDAGVALGLAQADTLKRSDGTFDKNGHKVSVTQAAMTVK